MNPLCESCRQRPADYALPSGGLNPFLVCSSCASDHFDAARYDAWVEDQIAGGAR